jgi:hypothetical protein
VSTLLAINIYWGLIVLALSLYLTVGNAGRIPSSTVPYMLQVAIAIALALGGFFKPRQRFRMLMISSVLLGLLLMPCWCGFTAWPGTDDAQQMGWATFMGGISFMSFMYAVVAISVGWSMRSHRRELGPSDENRS